MANGSEVPAPHVLVASIYRLSRRSNAALAFIDFVDKSFAIFNAYDHVVPEGEQVRGQSRGVKGGAQILNLRCFSRSVHSRETDEQRLLHARLFLGSRSSSRRLRRGATSQGIYSSGSQAACSNGANFYQQRTRLVLLRWSNRSARRLRCSSTGRGHFLRRRRSNRFVCRLLRLRRRFSRCGNRLRRCLLLVLLRRGSFRIRSHRLQRRLGRIDRSSGLLLCLLLYLLLCLRLRWWGGRRSLIIAWRLLLLRGCRALGRLLCSRIHEFRSHAKSYHQNRT